MANIPRLTPSDAKILATVFDPESAPEAAQINVDPNQPQDPYIRDTALLASLRVEELVAVKLIEDYSKAPVEQQSEEAKQGVFLKALAVLSDIAERHPKYASVWNNQAQLRRWRYGDRGVLAANTTDCGRTVNSPTLEARNAIVHALQDLDTAIALASPRSQNAAVSPAQGRLLAQAWTQRAAIFWGTARDLQSPEMTLVAPSHGDDSEEPDWMSWSSTRFEEEGSRCFFMAGLYGSEVGRAMAVLSNPTAKLCGGIVKEAMRRERCGV